MVQLISIDESFSTKSGALKSSASTKLNDRFRFKVALEDSLKNISSIDMHFFAKNWSLSHNTRTKDSTFRASWKPSGTVRVNLTQKVPKGNFFLVPNPQAKVTKTGGILGKHNFVSLEHDMLQRSSGATICLYGGDDVDEKRHKVKVNMLSNSGANATIRSKLWKGTLLHSASVSGSTKSQVLSLKSQIRIDDQKMKTKLSYSTASESLTMAGTHVVKIDKHKLKTSVVLTSPIKHIEKPSVQVGVNLLL